MSTDTAIIKARKITFRYKGAKAMALKDVTFDLHPGILYGILGPNGAGKSTLLQLMAGRFASYDGSITLEGREITRFRRPELAKRIAVVQQVSRPPLSLQVLDYVAMGRWPHRDWFDEADGDHQMLARWLEKTDTLHLAERRLSEISGGELQRVKIAKAFMQEPEILLLDEANTHMDWCRQWETYMMVREMTRTMGMCTVAVLHDLHLATRVCDRVMVLCKGRLEAEGEPLHVLTPRLLRKVYGMNFEIVKHDGTVTFVPVPEKPRSNGREKKCG